MILFLKSFMRLAISLVFLFGWFTPLYSQSIKPTPASDRLKSLAEKRRMDFADSGLIRFTNIGPSAMSGRVIDIDVNPENPAEFYAAYASGGLWYTNNNGISFKPLSDSLDMPVLGDVTVHWPSGTIWLGTGEANSSRSSYSGIGVYKSTDKGKTWQHMGLPESHHIGKIIIHPQNPDVVWVAATGHLYTPNAERGVYKTVDGGKTWKQTLYVNDQTGAIDLEINPANPAELYACMWQKSRHAWNFEENGTGSGIYKSNDGGQTWNRINQAGSGLPGGAELGRCGIALAASSPNVLYLLVDNQQTASETESTDSADAEKKLKLRDLKNMTKQEFLALDEALLDTFLLSENLLGRYNAKMLKNKVAADSIKPNALHAYILGDNEDASPIGSELYRSSDGGKTWLKTGDKLLANLYGPIGYYFGRIVVSPVNENKVLVLGITQLLSMDGGKTFRNIGKSNTHSDYHAGWFNPKNDDHIIIGNDGGVNLTYDNGAAWFKANMPPVGQVYSISTDQNKVFVGLQDNGVWYGPVFGGNPSEDLADPKGFRRLLGGDGMMAIADPVDHKTIYLGSQFGAYARTHLDTGGFFPLRPFHEIGTEPYRFNWLTPIMLSRHQPAMFYIAGNQLHRSMDKGKNLVAISPDLTNGKKQGNVPYGTITCIDESPLRFGLLYAGTDDGNVQVSKDAGYSWKRIDEKLPKGLWVSRVVASAYKEGRIYTSLTGYRADHFEPYIFQSDDYGEHWKAIHNGLPLEPVNVIREDPFKDSILYAGTDGGCYVSMDRGSNWKIMQTGLPVSVPVYDIAFSKDRNLILLGTHGRSIYSGVLTAINGVKPAIKPVPPRGRRSAATAD